MGALPPMRWDGEATKTCTVPGCNRAYRARGMCVYHYNKHRLKNAAACSVDGCDNRAEKRRLCGKHYYRFRMHGDATGGRHPNGAREAFVASFNPPSTDQCVWWPFSTSGHGYGSRFGGKYPHQHICLKFHGNPPTPSHEVAHGCGNRLCINPRHLRWALHVENEMDKLRHGTHRSQTAKRRGQRR